MKRRVVKQANQAYTITLPIDWVRKNKIEKKLEVDVNESERTLVINSEGAVEGGSVRLDVSELCGRNIQIHINALYAKGIDEIELISDEDISKLIMKATSSLMGYALVKQEGRSYFIKDIGGTGYSDLDEVFKRVFQMVILFYESAFSDIFGKSEETLDTLKSRDQEVNRFCLYLQRSINKSSYPDAINGRTLFTYSFILEQIGDEIERMWRTYIKYKSKKNEKIKELLEFVKELLGKGFDLYYSFNSIKIEEIYKTRDEIREKSLKLINLDAATLRFIRHAVKIAEQVADLNQLTMMRKIH